MIVLGINCGHDSGCTLIQDGNVINAINEERLTRVKSYNGFPFKSIEHILNSNNINYTDIDIIAVEGKSIKPSKNVSFDIDSCDWKKNLIVFLKLEFIFY